ncbi:MAG: hypothetical protein ACI9N1_000072 [Flavobacteriales bacterium]|jgi:hypothetical protein
MKNIYKFSIIALAMLTTNVVNAQLFGKKSEKPDIEVDMGAKAKFDNQIQENRVQARAKLKPYKYNGTKSTTFTYKTYDYVKTIEILTVEKTDYKFSFIANLVKYGNITVKIYDKPSTTPGRTLLFERADVGGDDFSVSLDEMNDKFRAAKAAKDSLNSELIARMRIKKVYVEYHIPAVDRDEEVMSDGDPESDNQQLTRTIKYSAMVVAVGYKNEQ